MGDSNFNVPVEVRTHELNQVHEMIPNVRDSLERADLTEAAEEVDRIYTEYIESVEATYPEGPMFAAYLSMPPEDWRIFIRYLNRARKTDGRLRVQWLQTKFVDRIEERMEEMEGN